MIQQPFVVLDILGPLRLFLAGRGQSARSFISCRKHQRSRQSRRGQNEIYMHRIVRKTKPGFVSLDQTRGQQ